MARLFRAVRMNPPTERDFMAPWELGRRPRSSRPAQVRLYQGVSTFETLEMAIEKATEGTLGEFIAELEVPGDVARNSNGRGHVDLEGATPGQLMKYVVQIHPRESVQ
jgi:hypothetical protein